MLLNSAKPTGNKKWRRAIFRWWWISGPLGAAPAGKVYAGKVKVGKLNIDQNQNLAMQYGATSIPRLMFFKGSDKPLETIVGLVPEQKVVDAINRVLGPGSA